MSTTEARHESFVETALKLSGKSEEEARTTGAVDQADEDVEALFAPRYQTSSSPVHQAVWGDGVPVGLFRPDEPARNPQVEQAMRACLDAALKRRSDGTLLDEHGKISRQTLDELAGAGYWGMLVDKAFGGQGAGFQAFARFLMRMATIDPTVAGLASVHGCIGAVDPIRTFGNVSQKDAYLPDLASGKRLSAFALTEPGAGSDLTAMRTTATLHGDAYVVNGEKLFITNAIPGRTIGLVCRIDGRTAVLIVDLPDEEDEHFQIVRYGVHALKHSYNNGLRFSDFRVPRENLLIPERGDGLTIAYHGLNRGRVALCANAAGAMRVLLATILPWARYRKTYGAAIETRELVRRRVGRLSALIVGCDALVDWCGWLLDQGYRGEMECIIAKIAGSEAQKEAAIELFMKTHGGRAFLHGHLFGDNLHDFLAPCIYEGEGEMLGMAFFKSLVKVHGTTFFEPIGRALYECGIKQPNPLNPTHLWALRKPAAHWMKWRAAQAFRIRKLSLPSLPPKLARHARFAASRLQNSRLEIDAMMRKHQLGLADRQCAMADISQRIQHLVWMLTTSLWAGRKSDPVVHAAADVLCRDLKHGITGRRPTSRYYKAITQLGKQVAEGKFEAIAGLETPEILMRYDQ